MVASLDHGEAIQAVFNRCDADKSGSIDVNELGKCMRLLGMNPTEAEVVAAMESVDENKNGKLEFDEFRGLMEPRLSEWLQNDQVKVLTDCFKVFDTEGTGKISKEMLSHIMTSQGDKLTEAELDRMMKAADSDGDGMIDYQEFVINHFFGPNSRVSTGTWGSLSWSGSVSGHISNAYTAASESVNAAVANVPSVGEMVDSAKNVADSAATKAQEMVANAPSKEAVVEGIKDAASNAATVAGEAVAVTRDAIAEQAAQAAAAVAPPAAQEQDVAQEVSAEAPPAAEPAEVPEVEEGKKEEPPAAGQAADDTSAPADEKKEETAAAPVEEEKKENEPAAQAAEEVPAPAAEEKEEAAAPTEEEKKEDWKRRRRKPNQQHRLERRCQHLLRKRRRWQQPQ
ncbi:unnamed protein product [Durusdinium trenchii]|uniref:Calmodulin n=1 Tax=Durusdinium trenchii TaxID=1381693 RepID=A0ABP0S6Y9_9DINO